MSSHDASSKLHRSSTSAAERSSSLRKRPVGRKPRPMGTRLQESPEDSNMDGSQDETISEQQLLARTKDGFADNYGRADEACTFASFAPGRVNLIGEHTDYNGGFVMPLALERGTIVYGTGRLVPASHEHAGRCRVTSESQTGAPIVFTADSKLQPGEPEWCNYVKGTVLQYVADVPKGQALVMDMFIASTVPLGGGVSSSAALTVSVATFVEAVLAHSGVPAPANEKTKARKCRAVENDFIGTPVGIMDQFVVGECLIIVALHIACTGVCNAI
jgi:galactokinase